MHVLDWGAEWTADLSTQLLPLDLHSTVYETRSETGTPSSRGFLGEGSREEACCGSHKADKGQHLSSGQTVAAEVGVAGQNSTPSFSLVGAAMAAAARRVKQQWVGNLCAARGTPRT